MTSKRRSGTSSARHKPAPSFFLDRCLDSRSLARALRDAGVEVQCHRDHFRHDTPDQDWLPAVGKHGWVVLTKDKHIRRNQLEREALIAAGVRAFVLTTGSLRGEEEAAVFVRHLQRMRNMVISTPAPFIAHVTQSAIKIMRPSRRK